MIAEIEEAIVAHLTEQLANARVKAQKGFEGIAQPEVNVSTEEGSYEKTTLNSYRLTLTIYVDVIFKSLGLEAQRRKGIYGILEAVVLSLFLQTLGLDIHPLEPKGFRDATTEEMLRDGLIGYTFTVSTYYHVTVPAPANVEELLAVAMSYYLSTPEGATPDAEDTVELPQG